MACTLGERADQLTYVGRERCVSCHAEVGESYRGSDHDLAFSVAADETIRGDFSGSSFIHHGRTYAFDRRDGRFWVTIGEPDGAERELEVRYAVGFEPLQQYLVELGDGRLQRLPVSWDTRPVQAGGGRWFHVYGSQEIGMDDLLHWSKPSQNWNLMCAECHSTNVQKRYDPETERYDTRWSEVDVSCEACHGPASSHVAWAERRAGSTSVPSATKGLVAPLARSGAGEWKFTASGTTARRSGPAVSGWESEPCAACHAHRTRIGPYRAGRGFLDAYRLSMLRAPLYYPDGQVREEVFVYGSFLQSRMYAEGVRCTDCHDPHTAGLRREGNALCSGCHLPSEYDRAEHHFHEVGSGGSRCVECHMPSSTFMGVDERRDHSFRTPRATYLASPNACVRCHDDRSTQWASERVVEWYGPPSAGEPRATALVFADAEVGDHTAPADLVRIAADSSGPEIVRATATSFLHQYPGELSLTTLAGLLADESELVRREAVEALTFLSPADRASYLTPLLDDPVRAVRIATAHAMAGVDPESLPPPMGDLLARGFEEYERAMHLNIDAPGTNLELGDYYSERGQVARAEAAYERALTLEPALVPAYANLGDFYRAQGREADALQIFRRGLAVEPESAALRFSLGLWYVRNGDLERAASELSQAAATDPMDPRIGNAYALALEATGRPGESIALLEAHLAHRPAQADLLLTLIAVHRRLGDDAAALVRASELARYYPGDARYRGLVAEIRTAMGGGG